MNELIWDFPGGITGVVLVLLIGLALIAFSYARTLKPLKWYWKIPLTLMRFLFLCGMILCLCNPRLEKKEIRKSEKTYKLAVVLDESGSMRKEGFWKRSRLQDAKTYLQKNLNPAKKTHHVEYFRFAETGTPVNSPEDAGKTGQTDTDFYGFITRNVPKFSAAGFDGALYLTDGVDTLGKNEAEDAIAALASSPMKHLMIPMTTALNSPPSVRLIKVEAPGLAYLETEIPISFMVRRVNMPPKSRVTLTLKKNHVLLQSFSINPGNGVQTLTARLPIRESGTDQFQLTLTRDEKILEEHSWKMEKTQRRNTMRVLVYNGALEYGNRFLRNVFRNDPNVKLDLFFAPNVINLKEMQSPVRFENPIELENYDVVVLFNLNRKQISEKMEKVLRGYLENGGGLIFITGNPMIAAEYVNSPLEKLLPVTFSEEYNTQQRFDARTAGIVKLITSGKRSPTDFDRPLQQNSEMRYKPHPLHTFELSETGKASPVFKQKTADGAERRILPKFEDYAPVKAAKPAANILAYFQEPAERKKHILLAYQNFGAGRSMVLATDPLWRWRLKQPSDDSSFEQFWKNLFSWLALGRNPDAQWILPNRLIQTGDDAEAHFIPGSYSMAINKLLHTLTDPEGVKIRLNPVQKGKNLTASMTLEKPGLYRIDTGLDGRTAAQLEFTVTPKETIRKEDSASEPDLQVLERFAELPNVELLDAAQPLDLEQYFPAERQELSETQTEPLWNNSRLFLVILGIFLLELMVRRKFGDLI